MHVWDLISFDNQTVECAPFAVSWQFISYHAEFLDYPAVRCSLGQAYYSSTYSLTAFLAHQLCVKHEVHVKPKYQGLHQAYSIFHLQQLSTAEQVSKQFYNSSPFKTTKQLSFVITATHDKYK